MALALRAWPSRSRIWACTVTSSPVVGSSAMSSRGAQARAMAIITRWRMPPDSWKGYLGSAPRGRGCRPRRRESAVSLASALSSLQVELSDSVIWLPIRFTGLSDGHRVLEDHGDVRAPELAQLVVGRVEDLVAGEADRPGLDDVPQGEQAHDRAGQHGLARPRLADDAEGLALLEASATRRRPPGGGPGRCRRTTCRSSTSSSGPRGSISLISVDVEVGARSLSATTLRLIEQQEHGGRPGR